jgi:CheY-like chemotaxis protein
MSNPYHIIIADDDADDQALITSAIHKVNSEIKVTSVYDGVQLLQSLNDSYRLKEDASAVHLILLDVNMPLMDGFTALKRIKDNSRLRNIPVFIISTMRTIERVEIFYELGAANVFSKPNNVNGYKAMLEEILANTIYLDQ